MAIIFVYHGLTRFFRPNCGPASGAGAALPARLWLIFLATASGAIGYRKISQFGRSNVAFFTDYFALAHGLPSHVSIGKLLQALDKKAIALAFGQCFNAQATAGDWLAGDGQSLRSTVQVAQEAGQTFVSVVSLYAQRTGLTVALQDYTDKKTGELALLRTLLADFQDRGVVLTLDALHAQKNSRGHRRKWQRLRAAGQGQPAQTTGPHRGLAPSGPHPGPRDGLRGRAPQRGALHVANQRVPLC